ncbi:hypothetical protein A5821_002110 [Enterococcus sp. 7F3_DIV0205]|uniref:DUF4865 domain-containing protein n=1 Tax=Candidatus Enterococcus palustris TaxID=1834189 RepID=A0AAQ3Y7F7_9ENTE|nr:DUF4865 family protein [Enterococcus sp. 7F3_DIV0205]OTN82549.1 hypothetical protein A5821_002460 [Enterococcus sp. 7F3_DIV0205]
MNAMQYKITLPDDYDMALIRNRVKKNGSKTDNFHDLLFKAYLISEKVQGAISNSYAPLYVWKNADGMNQFIFEGFYDNIINDFGWQAIQIGIPLIIDQPECFTSATYLLEKNTLINEQLSMCDVPKELLRIQETLPANSLGKLIIYNPDKWQATVFGFYAEKPAQNDAALYEILHISAP